MPIKHRLLQPDPVGTSSFPVPLPVDRTATTDGARPICSQSLCVLRVLCGKKEQRQLTNGEHRGYGYSRETQDLSRRRRDVVAVVPSGNGRGEGLEVIPGAAPDSTCTLSKKHYQSPSDHQPFSPQRTQLPRRMPPHPWLVRLQMALGISVVAAVLRTARRPEG